MATGAFSRAGVPSITTGRFPWGKQLASENSHRVPLAALFVGQATGPLTPWVVAFWQMNVVGSHGPSPVAPAPSWPPLQVWKTFGSEYVEPSAPVSEKPSWLLTDEQVSPCPISCSMSTPPSSAAHGSQITSIAEWASAPNRYQVAEH